MSGQPTVDNSSITPSEAVVDMNGTERQPAPIAGQPASAFDDNSSLTLSLIQQEASLSFQS